LGEEGKHMLNKKRAAWDLSYHLGGELEGLATGRGSAASVEFQGAQGKGGQKGGTMDYAGRKRQGLGDTFTDMV